MEEPKYHERKSPRLKSYSYSANDVFVTICTEDKGYYFGEIRDCVMHFTELGHFADKALQELESHYPYVRVLRHIVMPNHVHILLRLCEQNTAEPVAAPQSRSVLSVVVGGFKQSVTVYAKRNGIIFG